MGLGEESAQYASLLAAIASWRTGHAADAHAILAAAQDAVPPNSWIASLLLQFFQGRLDADLLLDKTGNIAQRTEAHTYVAFKLEIAGRHEDALTHFRWVLEQGAQNGSEHRMARNEMARLRHLAAGR